ncbi:MAG: Type 1 glutamine amidotransferase-like domain-containing protein [Clostridia bacterium]|nr:Type 1 glutamine amidotransferase-like domain-containing protein [Clostridia bacterium]
MKLVLIGGGDYGNAPEKPYNLKEIDEKIVELTNKAHPRLLFIGFNIRANHSFGFMKKHFMELGVQCEYLKYDEFSNQKTVDGKFKRADIVYIGGGNTMLFMMRMKQFGLDEKVREAANQGKVIAGRSAGAIIISAYGSSDSRHYKNKNIFTSAKGLGLVNLFFAPHFTKTERPDDMPRIMKNKKSLVAIGVDNQCSVVINDNEFEVVRSCKNSNAFKMFYKSNDFVMKKLEDFGKLEKLCSKQ